LNEGSDGADVTPGDSPFQTRAATTGKARSPTVVRRVGGTMSVDAGGPISMQFGKLLLNNMPMPVIDRNRKRKYKSNMADVSVRNRR